MEKKKVVIVGGTGYLGQHLLETLSNTQTTSFYDVAFTYHSTPPHSLVQSLPHFSSFPIDLHSGHGFDSISTTFGQPDVVVNCAALSVPRACETDPAAAMSINVPTSLVKWVLSFKEKNTLLIHLSTDQVYEGTKSFYREEDETVAVNIYGRSKVEAEKFISSNCSNYAILRSSIIYGPQTLSPVPKSLPIQWIDGVLSKGNKVDFFYDEFRCPIYVKDVVAIILALTTRWVTDATPMKLLLNLGGPDRVSRVQMAETVADSRGYARSLINPVSASLFGERVEVHRTLLSSNVKDYDDQVVVNSNHATVGKVDHGVNSPPDISMDISKLVKTLNISPTSYKDGVKLTLAI